ncbi:MAG: helix-turn-helix domain-containing protein [Actinomycetota bacterium]
MELKPLAYLGVGGNTTIEISQESLRSFISQIEIELLNSEVYSRVLASLQTMLGEAAAGAEILIKAVGREAIRMAYKGIARQQTTPLPSETTGTVTLDRGSAEVKPTAELQPSPPSRQQDRPTPPPPPLLPVSMLYQRLTKQETSISTLPKPEPVASLPEIEHSDSRDTPPTPTPNNPPPPPAKKPKKLTKAQKAALAVLEREDRLRQLGQELRKARQVRSLSLQQLHSQTLVPLHHLEALENGYLDRLPEDIYIRGFIRRLGNALGLDGVAMANSLPVPEPTVTTVPSWSLPESESGGFYLRPIHLYLGYTALMAGAVGGVAWLSQQSIPGANAVPETPQQPKAPSVKPSKKHSAPTPKPGLKSSISGIVVGSDIAPPEVISS